MKPFGTKCASKVKITRQTLRLKPTTTLGRHQICQLLIPPRERGLDEHYFRCTVDTLREARKLLYTAEYNPKISISSWLLQFEAVMHNYVFEQDEHLGTNTPLTAAATWDLIYGAIRNSSLGCFLEYLAVDDG